MTANAPLLSILSDQPADEDRLGFAPYAKTLADRGTDTPLTTRAGCSSCGGRCPSPWPNGRPPTGRWPSVAWQTCPPTRGWRPGCPACRRCPSSAWTPVTDWSEPLQRPPCRSRWCAAAPACPQPGATTCSSWPATCHRATASSSAGLKCATCKTTRTSATCWTRPAALWRVGRCSSWAATRPATTFAPGGACPQGVTVTVRREGNILGTSRVQKPALGK